MKKKLIRNHSLATSEIDGEIVMMNIDKGNYYGLDPIGSRIWELLEAPKSTEEIITILLTEYDTDKNTCEKDVETFLKNMIQEGLINEIR